MTCAQDERDDHCFFCGEEIPCLINGQNVCQECHDDISDEYFDGDFE